MIKKQSCSMLRPGHALHAFRGCTFISFTMNTVMSTARPTTFAISTVAETACRRHARILIVNRDHAELSAAARPYPSIFAGHKVKTQHNFVACVCRHELCRDPLSFESNSLRVCFDMPLDLNLFVAGGDSGLQELSQRPRRAAIAAAHALADAQSLGHATNCLRNVRTPKQGFVALSTVQSALGSRLQDIRHGLSTSIAAGPLKALVGGQCLRPVASACNTHKHPASWSTTFSGTACLVIFCPRSNSVFDHL